MKTLKRFPGDSPVRPEGSSIRKRASTERGAGEFLSRSRYTGTDEDDLESGGVHGRMRRLLKEFSGPESVLALTVPVILVSIFSLLMSIFYLINVMRVGYRSGSFFMWTNIVFLVVYVLLFVIALSVYLFGGQVDPTRMIGGMDEEDAATRSTVRLVNTITSNTTFSLVNSAVGVVTYALAMSLWIVYVGEVNDASSFKNLWDHSMQDYIQFMCTNVMCFFLALINPLCLGLSWDSAMHYRRSYLILTRLWVFRVGSQPTEDLYESFHEENLLKNKK